MFIMTGVGVVAGVIYRRLFRRSLRVQVMHGVSIRRRGHRLRVAMRYCLVVMSADARVTGV